MSPTAPDSIAIVLTTLGAATDPAPLAQALVEEGLAACVNIVPGVTSVYRWKGSVEREQEQQLVIKTSPARLAALEARLRQLHPYELPEFIVLDAKASAAYAGWVRESAEKGSG